MERPCHEIEMKKDTPPPRRQWVFLGGRILFQEIPDQIFLTQKQPKFKGSFAKVQKTQYDNFERIPGNKGFTQKPALKKAFYLADRISLGMGRYSDESLGIVILITKPQYFFQSLPACNDKPRFIIAKTHIEE